MNGTEDRASRTSVTLAAELKLWMEIKRAEKYYRRLDVKRGAMWTEYF